MVLDNRLKRIAQAAGVASCAGSATLWVVFLLFNPYSKFGRTTGSYLLGLVMIAAAVAGIYAFVRARPILVYIVFAISFCPVGLYLLLTPGIFRLIGYFDIAMLIAAALLHADIRRTTVSTEA